MNYNDEETLISALHGQQFLVITLSVTAPSDTHTKIVQAAVKAGVTYIMPNVYGFDIRNKSLCEDDIYSAAALQRCEEIVNLGGSYIAAVCGFWYEWSLALGEPWFGFDLKNKKATFFDNGNTKINSSTWAQCGRALAALLSLPTSDASPSVSEWKNEPFYFASFKISQRDMLDSIHRVKGTTDDEWEIRFESTAQRHKDGLADMQNGIMTGFAKAMYSRAFFPNGDADYKSSRGLANGQLGLPDDDLDAATKRAIDMVESGWNPFVQ